MKKTFTGLLLLITSTYTLANDIGYKFNIVYNVENKRILSVIADKNVDIQTRKICEEKLANGSESKKLETIAKGKAGIIKLTYFCKP